MKQNRILLQDVPTHINSSFFKECKMRCFKIKYSYKLILRINSYVF